MEFYGTMTISIESNIEYGSLDFLVWIHVLGYKKPNPRMNSCMEIIINPFVFLGFCYERT